MYPKSPPQVMDKRARLNRHSSDPQHSCGEMQEAQEVHSPSVVSCGDTAEVFEFVEASFDSVALLVGFEVIRDWPPAGRIAGDDGFSPHAGDQSAQRIGILRLVGQNPSR